MRVCVYVYDAQCFDVIFVREKGMMHRIYSLKKTVLLCFVLKSRSTIGVKWTIKIRMFDDLAVVRSIFHPLL